MQKHRKVFLTLTLLVTGISLLQAQTIEQQLDSLKSDIDAQDAIIKEAVAPGSSAAGSSAIESLRKYYIREVKNGNLAFVTRFYDTLAPISSHPYSFLKTAVEQKRTDIVSFFIKKGVDIHKHFTTDPPLLYIAAGNRDASMARLLLENKANVEEGYLKLGTPVMNAVFSLNDASSVKEMEECLGTVKVFLEFGADINVQRPDDKAIALHRAVFTCYQPLIELMLKSGASAYVNYTCQDKNSESFYPPLYYAVINAQSEESKINTVRLLLDNGAEINLDSKSDDPVINALMYPDSEPLMRLLAEKGLDINATDKNGRTLLWRAVFDGQENNVKVLLEKGADKSIAGKDTKSDSLITPLEVAKARKHKNIIKMLK